MVQVCFSELELRSRGVEKISCWFIFHELLRRNLSLYFHLDRSLFFLILLFFPTFHPVLPNWVPIVFGHFTIKRRHTADMKITISIFFKKPRTVKENQPLQNRHKHHYFIEKNQGVFDNNGIIVPQIPSVKKKLGDI